MANPTMQFANPIDTAPPMIEKHAVGQVFVCSSPKAGSGAGREELRHLPEQLAKFGIACEQVSQIDELSRRVAERQRLASDVAVVAAGGDGTLALVAQHVAPEIPIVPMPMGTENLFARHFGYVGRAESVAAAIDRGQTRRIDAGLANGRLFLVMVTAGFDAEVVRGMHLTRRGHIRRWSYLGPLWRAIRRYPFPTITAEFDPVPTTADSGATPPTTKLDGCWMMAFNLPRYAAELKIEPSAVGNDGWLNQITFCRGNGLRGFRYFVAILSGSHLRRPDVHRRLIRRAYWTSPTRTPYQIDGDYAGRLPVQIEILPGRITLMDPTAASR